MSLREPSGAVGNDYADMQESVPSDGGPRTPLALLGSQAFDNGVMHLAYGLG